MPRILFYGTNNSDSVQAEQIHYPKGHDNTDRLDFEWQAKPCAHPLPIDLDSILSRLPTEKSTEPLLDMNSMTAEAKSSPCQAKTTPTSAVEEYPEGATPKTGNNIQDATPAPTPTSLAGQWQPRRQPPTSDSSSFFEWYLRKAVIAIRGRSSIARLTTSELERGREQEMPTLPGNATPNGSQGSCSSMGTQPLQLPRPSSPSKPSPPRSTRSSKIIRPGARPGRATSERRSEDQETGLASEVRQIVADREMEKATDRKTGGRPGVAQAGQPVHCQARGEGGRHSWIALNGLALATEDIDSMCREEEVQKEETLGLRGRHGGSPSRERSGHRSPVQPCCLHAQGALWSTRLVFEVCGHKMWRKEQAIESFKDQMSAHYQYVDETDSSNCIPCYQLKHHLMELPPGSRPSGAIIELAVGFVGDFNSEGLQAALSFADSVKARTFFLGSVELMPLKKKLVLALGARLVTYWARWFISSWYPFEWGHLAFLQILRGRIFDAGKKCANDSRRSAMKALLNLTSEAHPRMLIYLGECTQVRNTRRGRKLHTRPAEEALSKASEDKLSLVDWPSARTIVLKTTWLQRPRCMRCFSIRCV
ncbi:hypothetical protein BKA70DRAFT_1241876 [Coprinopsis sp. MPI-PUGE-AT-0042]|nr:hypothetical protein BKA70DRAFT_1241876 [Coprinopsis sp. MPI-PUGE-AT-0042]